MLQWIFSIEEHHWGIDEILGSTAAKVLLNNIRGGHSVIAHATQFLGGAPLRGNRTVGDYCTDSATAQQIQRYIFIGAQYFKGNF